MDLDLPPVSDPTPLIQTPKPSTFNDALASMYAGKNKPQVMTPSVESENAQPSASNENIVDSSEAPVKKLVKRIRTGTPPTLAKVKRVAEIPMHRYADFGGIEDVLDDVKELVERPFRHPEIYKHLGVEAPRGILLHGPPGCGKTCLAQAIAGELGVPLIKVSAPEVVSGMSGESEGKIRELFDQAKAEAPCILFLDEVDAITPKRETAQREMERRIVAQLLTCLDDLSTVSASVLVIGATNRPDALDPALRRAGRFDRELRLAIPDEPARLRMLQVVAKGLKLSNDGDVDFGWIARHTPGYVGADLKALCQEAAASAVRRIFSSLTTSAELRIAIDNASPVPAQVLEESVAITRGDFEMALKKVQPSAKREGFAVVPNTSWEDIGALSYIREELRMAVVEPIRNADKFAAVGIKAPAGVLLWGPPGCGKTLLAKAVANEAHSNFISVKGPELLNKYVGESERAVRQVFERARASAPCVIFFDELDAICPRRSEESDASARVVNQLLTEMDGLEDRKQVFILAATNRPDMIDPAMTRPGRLDKMLYVRLPSVEDRLDILRAVSRQTPWCPLVDLGLIAADPRCEHFSGADLAALVREASMAAIREAIEQKNSFLAVTNEASMMEASQPVANELDQMQVDATPQAHHQTAMLVTRAHLDVAFGKVFKSVKPVDIRAYESLNASLRS